ncbi:Na(+)/H(+) antiporter subunit B [Tistrella bauzanensis]|uniref:Na(+)/H(+) antiporter subunit B n=2 Tax=Tistrella TaxID=171436 RepID=A0ABU9YIY2_9PROT|nr:Na(+)/H(+) antiporter subunit B [Tistrella bauzanensis]GGB58768.1 cation:proton antiporter [Tistrella bauzanensis]
MRDHYLILRVVSKLLIPFIIMFGLYVQFHGEYGPGGGFQAGVIIASAFILYALIFGLTTKQRLRLLGVARVLAPLGAIIFVGTGFVTLLFGGNFLEYAVLIDGDPTTGLLVGIIVVELGVGIAVTASMIALFFTFSERRD